MDKRKEIAIGQYVQKSQSVSVGLLNLVYSQYMNQKITFVLTGGTIDKEYEALDRPFTIGHDAVGRVLGFINPNFKATIIPLLEKVSVNITDEDKMIQKK